MLVALVLPAASTLAATGNAERGAELYPRACAACHSLAPGEHRTGPSPAGIWGRKAGSADGFRRYSPALKTAAVVWDATTLDAWLTKPAKLIAGTWMAFPGIGDAQARADLIAFLQAASAGGQDGVLKEKVEAAMRAGTLPDLKALPPGQQVEAIRYCGDTYQVTTYAGQARPIWEFNLRFKTDSSTRGPKPGVPVLLRANMSGDRFFVIFSDPKDISTFIQPGC
jgi:cytochrome c